MSELEFFLLTCILTQNSNTVEHVKFLEYRRLLVASAENNLKNTCLNFLEIISLVCLISGKLKT
jgi:hypothetical protein